MRENRTMKQELEEIIRESDAMYESGLAMFRTGKFYAGQFMVRAIKSRYDYLSKQPFMTNKALTHLSINRTCLETHGNIYKTMERYKSVK